MNQKGMLTHLTSSNLISYMTILNFDNEEQYWVWSHTCFVEIKLAMQFQISGYHKRVNSSDFGLVSIYGDVPQLVMLLHKTSH